MADTLFWSRKGEIACARHAPGSHTARWRDEGWQAIPGQPGRRVTYQCQHCEGGAIRRAGDRAIPAPLILNVDDHPAQLYARDRILRLHGFTVANADTGRRALDVARQLKPNLILLDVHLPDMDGRAVCRKLKADVEMGHIPVVLISSTLRVNAHEQEAERGEACADGFIAEPVAADVLASTIRQMLTRGA